MSVFDIAIVIAIAVIILGRKNRWTATQQVLSSKTYITWLITRTPFVPQRLLGNTIMQ